MNRSFFAALVYLSPTFGLVGINSVHGQVEVIKGSKAVDYSSPTWKQQKFEQDMEVDRYVWKMDEQKREEAQSAALVKAREATAERAQQQAEERKRSKQGDNDGERNKTSAQRGVVNPVTGEFNAHGTSLPARDVNSYPEYSEAGTSTVRENRSGYYQHWDLNGNSSWGIHHDNGYIQEFGPGTRSAFGVQSNSGFYQKWDSNGGYSYEIRK